MADQLHALIEDAARVAPDRLAVVAPDGTATFAELDAAVCSLAGWVAERTAPGDRVAVVADNSLAYSQCYYAVPRAGRVLTLVNQRLDPGEQAAQIAAAEPALLVGDGRFLDSLAALDASVGVPAVAFESDEWVEAVAPSRTNGDGGPIPTPATDDEVWLLFTSGSTGVPKGVVHTHRSLLAAAAGTIEGRGVAEAGVYLLPFPMCHVAGYNLFVQHARGSTVVLTAHFRPDEFVALVDEHGVATCSLAPTMLHALVAHLDEHGLGHGEAGDVMATLRGIAYGAAAMSPDLLRRAAECLDVGFDQGYGMTEAGGNVTFLGPDEHRRGLADEPALLRTAGRPHSGAEVRIVDDAGAALPVGEPGEIALRGDQVAPAYWRDAAATAEARTPDGWFRTGDIGVLDADGRLSVVDRRKDVIITGGENVSSREVEDVLSTHPSVDQVAVVGVPDAYWGEAICAVVVAVDGDGRPSADELVAHVRAHLSPFKRPRHVVFVDALPTTTNGKVAKDAVRALAGAALDGQPEA